MSQNFSINISTNWGFSNLESLDLFNGYAPISYDISETPDSFTAIGDDEGREIGGNGRWGSDFLSVSFGPSMNWQINEKHSLELSALWANGRVYTDDSIYYNFFENRECTGEEYVYFASLSLIYSINF